MALNGTGGASFWGRLLLALVPLIIVGLIGWGSLKSEVSNHQRQIDTKASRDVVDQQNAEVLRRLERIERLLERRAP